MIFWQLTVCALNLIGQVLQNNNEGDFQGALNEHG